MDASEKRRASVERAACWPRDCSYFQRVGEGVGEDRRRGEREGRKDAKQFILGPPLVFSFRDRGDATFVSSRGCIISHCEDTDR